MLGAGIRLIQRNGDSGAGSTLYNLRKQTRLCRIAAAGINKCGWNAEDIYELPCRIQITLRRLLAFDSKNPRDFDFSYPCALRNSLQLATKTGPGSRKCRATGAFLYGGTRGCR
jgi:hypothetical protein